jgi:xylan 1,4-beta-xylosidase
MSKLPHLLLASSLFASALAGAQTAPQTSETITIDAHAPSSPFPHFWEQTFGSGRAILSLRQSYRNDMRTVHAATGFKAVRFHGIFNDDVGLFDPNAEYKDPGLAATKIEAASPYNFSYIDQIYDGLLDLGVKPFVELSFMPKKMASDPSAIHPFWYHPNVSPPRDYAEWDRMIAAFAQHLVDRYGLEQVSTWDFEVWNEPNLDFWGGRPNMPTYYELYDHTALALKHVSPRLRVGGPSTAQAAYVGEFLAHCKSKNIPVDFTSSHVYGNDDYKKILGADTPIPRDRMVYLAVKKVHDEILASPFPHMPLFFSEYNASYSNEPDVTDSVYMGPWLANNIRLCDGLTQEMSYWTFSDVFEEQGVVRSPFYGGFGIIAEDGIPKPAFNAFAMLHQLGDQRLKLDSAGAPEIQDALATRSPDGSPAGSLVIALWNYTAPFGEGSTYTPPPANPGPSKSFILKLTGVSPDATVTILRLDPDHGNVVKAFDRMGRPATPSRQQIADLRAAGTAAPPETTHLTAGELRLSLPPQALVVLKVQGTSTAR